MKGCGVVKGCGVMSHFCSPSLKNLMIITESLTRGTKFVFNTNQVSGAASWGRGHGLLKSTGIVFVM